MDHKKFRSYRDELRKVFVGYAMTPIILVTAVAFLFIFVTGYMAVQQQNRANNETVRARLEKNLTDYRDQILQYSTSDDISKAIYNPDTRHMAYAKIYEFVNRRDVKCNFYFFNASAELIMSNTTNPPDYIKDSSELDWGIFKRMRINPGEVSISINRVYSTMNKYSIFTLCKAIVQEGEIQGYIIFELLENDVYALINGFANNDTLIADRYFNVAAATNNIYTDNLTKLKSDFRKPTGIYIVGSKKYYLCRQEVLEGNFYIYTLTHLNYYERTFLLGALFLAVLFLMITGAMILVAKRIAWRKTVAIDQLLEAISSVQKGNLDTQLSITSNDEFQIIAQAYNRMLCDIKNLIEQNKEETKRSMLAEIKQLESQFNPHFLFNTLETIRCMVKMNPQEVERLILNLSALLRYSINNTIKTICLRDDIAYTQNYLEILKYRFNERLDYEIVIEEEAGDCIVPKLLVQPLIENAIKHGFEDRHHLTIRIKARILDDQLIIVIFDDGIGMTEAKVTQLQFMLKDSTNNTENIGLFNVNRRIKLLYGESYGLDIISEASVGTTIRIAIPADYEEYV